MEYLSCIVKHGLTYHALLNIDLQKQMLFAQNLITDALEVILEPKQSPF